MALSDWSPTAASNSTVGSITWAENQFPSTVNDSARQLMADVRSWYENTEWRDWGHTVTYASATTFTVAGDATAIYEANRPIRCTDSSTLYGYVASSSYSNPNTTVTVTLDSGSLSASLASVALGPSPSQKSIPAQALRGSLTVGLSSGALVANASSGWVPRGHLAGLTLSNNGTDATNDIDIAVGECADSTNAYILKLTSALTKQLDAAWAVGTNAGGLDTGTKAVSTWYHVFLIRKDSDGSIDALFSTSVSSPTMPTGYTYKRRIGSILTDGAGAIIAFKQIGEHFLWVDPPLDVNTTEDTTANLQTLSVPLGVKVEASINVAAGRAGANSFVIYVSSPDANDEASSASAAPLGLHETSDGAVSSAALGAWMRVMTNTSSQIRTRADAASTTLRIATLGWEDARGRFD